MTGTIPRTMKDIMTREIAVLHEEENLEIAESAMKTFRFRHLPVVEGDKLIGLVTERDLLRASISSLDQEHDLRDHNLKRYFFVREVMKLEVTSVRPETLLLDAIRLMKEKKLGCLPVTEEGGKLVGIVTGSDLIAVLATVLHDQEALLQRAARQPSAHG